MQRLEAYIRQDTIRPLTDNVIVKKPEAVPYESIFGYHISEENEDIEETIKRRCRMYVTIMVNLRER